MNDLSWFLYPGGWAVTISREYADSYVVEAVCGLLTLNVKGRTLDEALANARQKAWKIERAENQRLVDGTA